MYRLAILLVCSLTAAVVAAPAPLPKAPSAITAGGRPRCEN
ncbi:MAG TPA: hypothetical protein VKD72_28230 [Gemmataceae bacterium]|nr:hypothetical protein [Gemmataceae bacterium]